MASLLLAKCYSPRPRAISNGGLGGFVELAQDQSGMQRTSFEEKGTWPKRKRRAPPPPLDIENSSDKIFVSQTVVLSALMADPRDLRTPRTPRTADTSNFVTKEDLENLASPFLSRYNVLPLSVYCSLPTTPALVEQPILPPPLELPGSLLLPSQGFPQSNPPRTPPRNLGLCRSVSDESRDFLTPELSISSSEESEMLKHFSAPKRRASKPPPSASSTSSASNLRSVGKSISTMTASELLQVLPSCDKRTVNDDWIPAMVTEHEKMLKLLHDAASINLDAHQDLKDFGEDLRTISEDARKISTTYEKALDSAESLLERDTRICLAKLETTESHLDEALAAIEVNNEIIGQKDGTIKGLQQAMDDVVRTLGVFIQDHMHLALQDVDSHRVKDIMQIITDHSTPAGADGRIQDRYLRVPEASYLGMLAELQDVQYKVDKYRELAVSQHHVIQNQSAKLDDTIARYEKCVHAIQERDHEVFLLKERNADCLSTIRSYETGAKVSPPTRAVQDQLYQRQDDLEQALQRMSDDHYRQLESRDAEIYHLRSRLGSAEGEAMARRADVKNVITHTQALLSPVEPPQNLLPGSTSKERKKLSLSKLRTFAIPVAPEKNIRHRWSSNSSGWSGSRTSSPSMNGDDTPQHSMEYSTPDAKPETRVLTRSERPIWACGISPAGNLAGLAPRDNSTLSLAPRIHSESLPAASDGSRRPTRDATLATTVTKQLLASPLPAEKKLPHARSIQGTFEVHFRDDDEEREQFLGPSDSVSLSPAPKILDHGQVPKSLSRKRVLSRIAEASSEDADEERDGLSVSSSDQEVFRRGMRLIDFLKESDMRTSPSKPDNPDSTSDDSIADIDDAMFGDVAQVRDLRGSFRVGPWATRPVHKEYTDDTAGGSEGESPPMSVGAMYHAQHTRTRG